MGNTTSWTYDADTGVYKNHALSGKLLEQSAQKMVFVPFTDKIDTFGKKMGDTITMVNYQDLSQPTSAKLNESTRIPIDKLSMGHRSITVEEWGRGVQYTSLMQDLGKFDPESAAQKKLTRQMERAMDGAAATAFKAAKIAFIPTTLTGGVWDTDGTPSTAAAVNLNADHLGVIRDYMANNIHAPFYDGSNYVGIFTTLGLRGLKQDRRFEAWNMYLRKGDLLYRSECGRCEQIRLVECVHSGALTNGVGTGSVLGEGVVFGEEAVGRAEVEFPHLRANPNYLSDFGRIKAVAWYGVVAFATFWDTANDYEAKIVRVTSS
jgi:N4-gp56 family major capsid protein